MTAQQVREEMEARIEAERKLEKLARESGDTISALVHGDVAKAHGDDLELFDSLPNTDVRGVSEGVREKLGEWLWSFHLKSQMCEPKPWADLSDRDKAWYRNHAKDLLASLPASQETVSEYQLTDEDRGRLELIRDHDGNDLSPNDKALLTRLAGMEVAL